MKTETNKPTIIQTGRKECLLIAHVMQSLALAGLFKLQL